MSCMLVLVADCSGLSVFLETTCDDVDDISGVETFDA